MVLPLIGIFMGTAGVIVMGLLAVGSHVAVAYFFGAGAPFSFLAQIPTCLLVTAASVVISRRLSSRNNEEVDQALGHLTEIRNRHASLKAQVIAAESEEAVSLQIYALSKALAESLSWKEMAPRLATGIQKIFGSHEFLLYALDSNGRWELMHRRGSWSKEPPISGAFPSASIFLTPPKIQEVVPVLEVPIVRTTPNGDEAMGILFLKNTGDRSEADLVRLGDEFGRELAMALSKALLFNQMEIHSRVDGLTGVLRRQAFMDRLDEEIKKANAFSAPFCLLMIDIDHFKAVNDGHGHAAGDAVLARVGQILKESIYETDVVGRYGGEEFIVLLPHAQVDGVIRKAESIRQRFERETINSGFERLRITVSIGLSHFPAHGRTAQALIGQADQALYQAKESGRNRVIAA
jgi:diguanylate cyclase (GGDEF)-like protein